MEVPGAELVAFETPAPRRLLAEQSNRKRGGREVCAAKS